MHVATAVALAAAILTACSAPIRATGPKTAYDHCVDDCDERHRICGHPDYPPACNIEYDACAVACDGREQAKRR